MVNELVEAIVRVMDNSSSLANAVIKDNVNGKEYIITCYADGDIKIEINSL